MNPALSFVDLGIAPDINSVSYRAVYPTAPGGTLASASAAINANTTVGNNAGGQTVTTPNIPPVSRNTVWYWFGLVIFLGVTVWIARKAGGEEDFRNIRPTFYNFMTITLTAILGIVGLKVLASKFHVPGVSDIVLAA